MFKILELKNASLAPAAEVGTVFDARTGLGCGQGAAEDFQVSGHNPEGNYWWARDFEGLRKCWISTAD